MIGYLRGTLLHNADRELIVETGGVGYVVSVDARLEEALPAVGDPITLFIYTLVREDALELYGFATFAERELFTTLLKVSGIGTRLAQSILTTYTLEDLEGIVATADAKTLAKVPGIGPRTAERLIVELKGPLARLGKSRPRLGSVAAPGSALSDAAEALGSLGFRKVEVEDVLAQLRTEKFAGDVSKLIKEALRRLSR
jgi:holliday junction DNA helicase RuvA